MFLEKLVDVVIRRRYVVLAAAALLAVVGIFALLHLPFDAFPDTTPVMVQVNVAAPGWAPEDIERQITFPIERELSGLAGLIEIRSISKYGIAQANLIFEDAIDVYLARQQVTERLVSVRLPDGVEAPRLGPVSTGLGEVFHYVVIARSDDPTAARTAQEWIIKPQLQSIRGVAEVNSWGGFEKQYHILVDPQRLAQYGLSLKTLVDAVSGELRNVAGGRLTRGGEQTIVRGVGVISRREEIEMLVVETRNDVPIHVRDVADVVVGHEIRRGAATADGQGEVVLGLGFMLSGENSRTVTHDLMKRLEEIQKTLPSDIEAKPVYMRTQLVDQVLRTVEENLLMGAALVIAVLFIFLGNLRAGLIVASAIPLSMLFAFALMAQIGIIGSLMSLGAIDFGLAVDNAVIQVENSVKRLQESGDERSRLTVIKNAILEVRKPTLYGELIIILVYLPILTLQGIEGKLFRPMALTVTLVLIGSLILSFTVIPALIATFLRRTRRESEPKVVVWTRFLYAPVLDWALRRKRIIVAASAVALAAGVVMFSRLGGEFIPRLSEGTITINVIRLAGVDLSQSVDNNTRIEKILIEKFPDEVERLWSRIGTAELSTDPMGLELTDIFITLKPREQWTKARTQQELAAAMDRELSDIPGMNRVFTQPIEMRANELIAGIRGDIGVKIFGDDLDVLEAKSEEIAALIETIPGAADVSVEQLTGQPEMQLAVDRERIARLGISASEVLRMIESFGGVDVGEVYEGQRRFPLAVRLDSAFFAVPEDVEHLPFTSGRRMLTLADVTRPSLATGYSTITREWGKRRAVVQCNVRGRDVGSFVDELRERIDREIDLDAGYFVRFGGQFENLERAQRRLMIVVPVVLLLILGLLYWTYSSLRDALLIFTGVPLAALGGVVALAVRGMPFSISAAVGFIALSGIAVLNGLVLVSTIKRLRAENTDLLPAIREGALSRLRPVLMTALVAAIGFVPMAVSSGIGAEVQRPLATVVIGGILSSTALTLILLPVLYSLFGARSRSES